MSYINDYKSDEDENNQGNCSYNITIINRLTLDRHHSLGLKLGCMKLEKAVGKT